MFYNIIKGLSIYSMVEVNFFNNIDINNDGKMKEELKFDNYFFVVVMDFGIIYLGYVFSFRNDFIENFLKISENLEWKVDGLLLILFKILMFIFFRKDGSKFCCIWL